MFASVSSLVTDQLLYAGPSMFGRIVVRDAHGFRVLAVGDESVEQTAIVVGEPMTLVHEYNQLLLCAMAAASKPQRVLAVGLGGGALPRFLRLHFPSVEVDVVEIDPAVVDVTKRFFGVEPDDKLRIHVGDALPFLKNTSRTWDVILLDAYRGDEVPVHLTTPGFLALAHSRLTPGGALASNLWGPPSEQYEGLLAAHHAAFPQLYLTVGQRDLNHVLVGIKRGVARSDRLIESVKKLGLPFALHETVAKKCVCIGDDGKPVPGAS